MISKNLVKYIKSLERKKIRSREHVFVAEGPKVVGDLCEIYTPVRLIATEGWFASAGRTPGADDVVVDEEELRKVSFLMHPQDVMGVFKIPEENGACRDYEKDICLALDGVQDPGNLGTIIRIADWFGITTVYCSHETADAYNPKVVQATMGSIARVNVVYTDLNELFGSLPADVPVYGTFLDGKNIYDTKLSANGIIVMGNEGNGISDGVARFVNKRLLIPAFPEGRATADSLNVAVATAVTCSEFRRSRFSQPL